MERLASVEEVLALDPARFSHYWPQIDKVIATLPRDRQFDTWHCIESRIDKVSQPKGMPLFRMGVLKLLMEADETVGLQYLEAAYQEDEKFGRDSGQLPHRMGAYRLLSLVREYFGELRGSKPTDWQRNLLLPENRDVLVSTLLMVYNQSLSDIFDMQSEPQKAFESIIADRNLSRFAAENYYCAESLLQAFFLKGQAIVKSRDEYPLARAVVGLLGGVLEAVFADRVPEMRGGTLGRLITEAHKRAILRVGTRLSTLSSLMLHLRNYVHPDRDSLRTDYFVDINTAKGCKAALDWTIAEMLQERQANGVTA